MNHWRLGATSRSTIGDGYSEFALPRTPNQRRRPAIPDASEQSDSGMPNHFLRQRHVQDEPQRSKKEDKPMPVRVKISYCIWLQEELLFSQGRFSQPKVSPLAEPFASASSHGKSVLQVRHIVARLSQPRPANFSARRAELL